MARQYCFSIVETTGVAEWACHPPFEMLWWEGCKLKASPSYTIRLFLKKIKYNIIMNNIIMKKNKS